MAVIFMDCTADSSPFGCVFLHGERYSSECECVRGRGKMSVSVKGRLCFHLVRQIRQTTGHLPVNAPAKSLDVIPRNK
jgi:hypothetical protein